MRKYYLSNGKESIGPFDKEELRAQKITKTTPIWSEDMEYWKKAGEIDEIKAMLLTIPPPINHSQNNNHEKPRKSSFVKYLLIGIGLIAFITIGSNIISDNNNSQDISIPVDDTVEIKTRNIITNLVQVTTNQYSVDTFGGISNLDVIVTNNTDYTIDQITVAVDYIKKNNGIYKTEYLTFNNIPANENKTLSAPESYRGLSVNLTKQTITSSELNLCYDINIAPAIGDPDPFKCN